MTPEKKFAVEKVLVAGNRGPCGGVNMALEAVGQVLGLVQGREPVYTNWDIVNNKPIMEELAQKGLVNVRFNMELVPDNSILFLSAHGVSPSLREEARRKNCLTIDVTCPLVNKVHSWVKKSEREGKHIVYLGVADHPETIGVLGEVNPQNITLVETVDNIRKLSLPTDKPIMVHTQTTLLPEEVKEQKRLLIAKSADVAVEDVCYAMAYRDAAVTDLISKGINLLLVVGSVHSHNSQMLRKKGDNAEIPAHSVDKPEEIDPQWFSENIRTVGVTSGASVLERFLAPVIEWFKLQNPNLNVQFQPQAVKEEEMTFRLPQKDLEALQARYGLS